MSDHSRRQWLTAAGTLAAAAALSSPARAEGAAGVDDFVHTVKGARVFDLSFVWTEQSPVLGLNPPYAFALNRTHKMTHEFFGQAPGSQLSWASDIMYFSGQHGSPTIDAIGHIGRNLRLHGGVDALAATSTPGGIGADLGIEAFPADLLVNRVVFLDVARHVAGGRPDPLPGDFEIKGEHLEATMRAQGVEVRRGDSLLIRTGFGQFFTQRDKYLGAQSPGPGPDGARWIIAKGVRLVVDGVSKRFGTSADAVPALSEVSLAVGRREFCTVIGPSGCGKSTLLAMIGGLVLPDAGQVRIDGQPVEGPDPRRVAMVFQDPAL